MPEEVADLRLTETTMRDACAPFVLALDVGTSSARAALYDWRGREITGTETRLARSLETTADGGAELNAHEGVEQVAEIIDATLARASSLADHIEAVAVSCFWHSLVGVDNRGQAVTPVYCWADTRAAPYAEDLRRRFDEKSTHARTGCRFHASYWPAKLLWLQAEHTQVYRSVERWMSFAEYLVLCFTGEDCASISMASGTGLLNQKSCDWDAELTNDLQLDLDSLPAIAVSRAHFAKIGNEYAKRWPQLQKARWFPAIGDGAANNIGANCTNANRAALMIGTSGAMRVLFEGAPPHSLPESLWCYRADSRRIVVGGALSDGGGLYSWMRETLALPTLPDSLPYTLNTNFDTDVVLEEALEAMEPDAHGLTLLPFWTGERSTGWHASACGAILGLRLHTRPLEILRASMEAVCYRFALIAAALKLATNDETIAGASDAPNDFEIIASGGALLHSTVWAQMLADTLNRIVHMSAAREASSRGAALLALEALGTIKIEDAPVEYSRTYEPDPARHAKYRIGLARQQKLYAHLIEDNEIARVIGEAVPPQS